MKSVLYKLGKQTAVTVTMLLLVFAPFQTLIAQADIPSTDVNDTTRSAPASGVTVSNTTTNNNSTIPASNASNYSLPPSSTAPSGDIFASCGLLSKDGISNCVLGLIYAFTIGIGSVFAYVAAYFFDITIQLSLNGASYGLDFISTSWTTARDLGNMAFLFILLYIAFTIIFKADTGQTKTMLALVIVVALLVNFSFFFTRVVIDAGNILAIQFYNAIPAPPISQTIQGSPISGTVASAASLGGVAGSAKDLTAGIMNMLNIQGLLNNNSFASTNGSFIATVFIYIAGAIVLWILTVAFITNGIKFLFRVVVLWFLIVASPLALIAIAVQGGTDGYFKKWRQMLIQHSFYPVAFMFVFLILNNFAVTMSSNNGLVGGVFTALQASSAGTQTWGAIGAALVSLFIRLALVIGVLYVAMQVSTLFSLAGASYAEKAGGWFGGKLKSTMLLPGRLTARTAGGIYAGGVGSAAYDTAQQLKGTRFGNTRVGAYLRKGVLEPVAGSKFGGAKSYTDVVKARKDVKTEATNSTRDIENKEKVEEIGKKIAENIKTNLKAGTGISDDDKKKIQNLNKRELEAMNAEQIKKISALLTEDQVKRVKEMEKLTDKEKEEIDNTWNEHSTAAPVHKASKALSDMSKANSHLASPDPDVTLHTMVNTPVNKVLLDMLKQKAEAKLDLANANKEAASTALAHVTQEHLAGRMTVAQLNTAKGQYATAEAEHRNASKMVKGAETAEELRSKVQPHHGDMAAAGEFKIKNV